MAYGVTTQWDDIHRKLGNFEPLPLQPDLKKLQQEALEIVQSHDPLENKNLEELNELEDEFEDEFLKQYREKRLQEIKELQSKPRFGMVKQISKQEFIDEVNNAPESSFVVLHLYQEYIEKCQLINQILDDLAKKYIFVKFLRSIATTTIPNFRDQDCPAFIIYKSGTLVHSVTGFKNCSELGVEKLLIERKIIEIKEEEDLQSKLDKKGFQYQIQRGKKEDFDSSDEEDREYSNPNLKFK